LLLTLSAVLLRRDAEVARWFPAGLLSICAVFPGIEVFNKGVGNARRYRQSNAKIEGEDHRSTAG